MLQIQPLACTKTSLSLCLLRISTCSNLGDGPSLELQAHSMLLMAAKRRRLATGTLPLPPAPAQGRVVGQLIMADQQVRKKAADPKLTVVGSVKARTVEIPGSAPLWQQGKARVQTKATDPHDIREGLRLQKVVNQRRMIRSQTRKAQLRLTARRLEAKLQSGPTLGQGVLGDRSITTATLRDYAQRLAEFYDYLEVNEIACDFEQGESADSALTLFMNYQFSVGELASEGEKAKAAFEAYHPRFARHGDLGLPKARRALIGWKKATPPKRTYPLP